MGADTFLHIKPNEPAESVTEFRSSNLIPSLSVQPTFVSPPASSLSAF